MSDNQNCRNAAEFENWAKSLRFKPYSFCHPKNIPAIDGVVNRALSDGRHLRICGNKHSWSQFVQTADYLLQLNELEENDRDLTADPSTSCVTVSAGIRLQDLVEKLRKLPTPLGLRNTGSILQQSLAGAVSTGTHGTGTSLGNFATFVKGMQLLTMRGGVPTVLDLDSGREEDALYLRAARVSMGAVGVITKITVECVKDYGVELRAFKARFKDIADQNKINELNAANQRVRIWWLLPPLAGAEMVVSLMNDSDNVHDSNVFESLGALINFLLGGTPDRPAVLRGYYDKILTLPFREIRHRECEYAIPAERTAEALNGMKEIADEADFRTTLPIEIRFVRSDDALLSPANRGIGGPPVCYIGVNTRVDNDDPSATEIFARFEPLMKELGGRPHWGKHFSVTPQELQTMYGEDYQTFLRIRNELDPAGFFENTLIGRLFPRR